jgi:hypothetical protein
MIRPRLIGAFACSACLLVACGGGSDSASAPPAEIAAMAGLYKFEAGPVGNTVSATVIADDQGHFIGTSVNLLPDYFEGVDFSGAASNPLGDRTWASAGSLVYSEVDGSPVGTMRIATTMPILAGTFGAASSFTYSLPDPPLPIGYPSTVTVPRVTIPPGPYTLAGLAGHYGQSPGTRPPTPPLLDVTIDASGHISGTVYATCNIEGTVGFVRPDLNVVRVTGTFTNCDALNGARTLLADVVNYDTAYPWFELWRQSANGQVLIVQGIKQ